MIEILYADNHIVIVNKPSGIPTQETQHEISVESWCKIWAKEHYNKNGNVFLYATHRLDKLASGIVVLAKTSKSLSRLQQAFATRDVQKTYLVWVEGHFEKKEDFLEDYLIHADFKAKVVKSSHQEGKLACLSYKVIRTKEESSLLEIDLHTGRYHQIRCQFSHRHHPVLNDTKYGAKRIKNSPEIALHHKKITFSHPVTKNVMTIEAPIKSKW